MDGFLGTLLLNAKVVEEHSDLVLGRPDWGVGVRLDWRLNGKLELVVLVQTIIAWFLLCSNGLLLKPDSCDPVSLFSGTPIRFIWKHLST